MTVTLKDLADHYSHYTPLGEGWCLVYCVDRCDVCEELGQACNSVRARVDPSDLEACNLVCRAQAPARVALCSDEETVTCQGCAF